MTFSVSAEGERQVGNVMVWGRGTTVHVSGSNAGQNARVRSEVQVNA